MGSRAAGLGGSRGISFTRITSRLMGGVSDWDSIAGSSIGKRTNEVCQGAFILDLTGARNRILTDLSIATIFFEACRINSNTERWQKSRFPRPCDATEALRRVPSHSSGKAGVLMLLQGKSAVIYGAAGAVGSAVAKVFAREGAQLFLTGRNLSGLEDVAGKLTPATKIDVSTVDALDGQAVHRHLDHVFEVSGRLDISFNLISMDDVQGTPLVEMEESDFMQPIDRALRSQFITASAAGRRMSKAGAGVILMLTASPGRIGAANVGGFGPACAAMEGLVRQLGTELGPRGVRVICLRSTGSPESPGVGEVFEQHGAAQGKSAQAFAKKLADTVPLRHLSSLEEVANAAAMLASDYAGAMTATTSNVTCGGSPD
jgi:NAD(P)-dependent dehydrogenase (short-subunit alcohol dehydrogenase family)